MMRDEPKKLEWRRFYVCVVAATELVEPTRDWLWQRHQPKPGRRMQVTHSTIVDGVDEGVSELHLLMEYAARGSNKTDVLKKVWEALTKLAGTESVMARAEARCIAMQWLDFADYKHNDKQWLTDKIFAAQAVAAEVAAKFDPSIFEPDEDEPVGKGDDWLDETG